METYDLGSDVGRLHLIVCAGMVNNLLIRLPLGKQLLLETVAVVADHGVGTIQNAGGRAVVLIEHDRNGIGKILRKVQNDVHIRSAPRIDRLVRITDNVQAVVRSRQLTDQLILFGVDVLKLINENIRKTALPLGSDIGELLEHPHHPENEVIKVKAVQLFLPVDVEGIDLRLLFIAVVPVGKIRCPFRRNVTIFAVGNVVERRSIRDVLRGRFQCLVGFLENRLLVFRIEHRKVARPAHGGDIFTQHTDAEAVDRADPRCTGIFRNELADTFLHFVGRLVGKGDRKNLSSRHVLIFDQMRNPHRQNPGLSRAGAGNDTDIFMVIENRFFLVPVKAADINHGVLL